MDANIITAVTMMWQGMFGLMVVMGLIALIVFGLGKAAKKNSSSN